ncbi:cytidylate kinase [Sporanaerobium hydrogeniformans]|uniref:Cytidylate kinase n=1 Tax=Sporanaerobium hydrogeniformans TaxID=3072179 RepID=A0AC61D8L5_9FIRM|nr:cytidylate kinase-like family protein [Sporanaerobium hydrogeniformans]PHV69185.1 cytidylate kinase [Sporanaerobium hydrogeniformans]
MDKIIITIGRQFGSGGRYIGKKLAEDLNIPFYDKELIELAAKEHGMSPEVFANIDETASSSFLYSLAMGINTFGSRISTLSEMPLTDKLFIAETNTIKRIATEGSCVIVGRCADYILADNPNCIHIFVHGDFKDRVNRAVRDYGVPADKAESIIAKTDKKRATYYEFYSSQKWSKATNYTLCLDSSVLGLDNCVDIIKDVIAKRQ